MISSAAEEDHKQQSKRHGGNAYAKNPPSLRRNRRLSARGIHTRHAPVSKGILYGLDLFLCDSQSEKLIFLFLGQLPPSSSGLEDRPNLLESFLIQINPQILLAWTVSSSLNGRITAGAGLHRAGRCIL